MLPELPAESLRHGLAAIAKTKALSDQPVAGLAYKEDGISWDEDS